LSQMPVRNKGFLSNESLNEIGRNVTEELRGKLANILASKYKKEFIDDGEDQEQ
jgi:hypothetical protein